jgi:malate permease and related proteins
MIQLFNLMVEVMLPLSLLVGAGAVWPLLFPDTDAEALRSQLNRLVLYLFFPCILFAVGASTRITGDLLAVPLLVGLGMLGSGVVLYLLLYVSPLGRGLADPMRAALMIGGMWGNTFNLGAPVLMFFFGRDAVRYAVFNDMLMTMPFVWTLGVWIATRLGSHGSVDSYPSVWRVVLSIPLLWAFLLGLVLQYTGLAYVPLVNAAHMIGQATIPLVLFVLGMTIPWRNLTPRLEILAVAGIKLLFAPLLVAIAARLLFAPLNEAHYAASIEATTPAMMTVLLLAERFRLDSAAAALLIGWSTILFWLTLPLTLALGLIH